jgi:hypothetical protein
MVSEVRDVLRQQFEIAWMLTDYHLKTLSTEECLWRPAKVGLHVHQGPGGRWHADWPEHEGYDLGPSSIGWLTWHLGFWWSMVLDHSFGDGALSREQVLWPGSADAVRTLIGRLEVDWRGMLESVTDGELRSTERTRWPLQDRPFRDVVAWVNVELAKNAAEIGYARFLYAQRA